MSGVARLFGSILLVLLLVAGCIAGILGGAPTDPGPGGERVDRGPLFALAGLGLLAMACGFFGLLALWGRLFHGPRAVARSRVTVMIAVILGCAAVPAIFVAFRAV